MELEVVHTERKERLERGLELLDSLLASSCKLGKGGMDTFTNSSGPMYYEQFSSTTRTCITTTAILLTYYWS